MADYFYAGLGRQLDLGSCIHTHQCTSTVLFILLASYPGPLMDHCCRVMAQSGANTEEIILALKDVQLPAQ